MLAVGHTLNLDVIDLAFGGDGVAKTDNFVVFIPGGLPGDQVFAEITSNKKRHATAKILQILRPSPDRVTPRCPHFEKCGGCALQHLSYPAQLRYKSHQVFENLRRLGGIENPPLIFTSEF